MSVSCVRVAACRLLIWNLRLEHDTTDWWHDKLCKHAHRQHDVYELFMEELFIQLIMELILNFSAVVLVVVVAVAVVVYLFHSMFPVHFEHYSTRPHTTGPHLVVRKAPVTLSRITPPPPSDRPGPRCPADYQGNPV